MTIHLERTVRFAINPGDRTDALSAERSINGFAGSPPVRGLGRHYEMTVLCRGEPDTGSGYLLNIKAVDVCVREGVVPLIAQACLERPETDPGTLMPGILGRLESGLGAILHGARWNLSPYYSVEMMNDDREYIVMRQRFEFAAAHRLHVGSMSNEENRGLFGKCNNPSGHGHNYEFEPAVRVRLSGGRALYSLDAMEQVVQRVIIHRFDHKHLNLDCAEFAPETGINPSVENIARVCYGLLRPAIDKDSGGGAELVSIRVWETEKTCAEYGGVA